MADVDFDRFGAGDFDPPGRVQRMVNMGAAVLSVGLVVGMGLWGYRLAVRDVAGVPVVRALAGPMRVAPDNPGGNTTAHQGLAVNEVAAEGAAAGPAERLVLAPPPVDLAEEDAAGLTAGPAAPVSARDPGTMAMALPEYPPEPAQTQEDAIAAAVAAAMAEDFGITGTTPLAGSLDAEAEPTLRLAASMPQGAFASAVRPRPRPGSAAVAAGALAPTPAALAVVEVDAGSLETGSRLVQLGAFETQDLARAEWDRVVGRFGELMAGKARVLQEAQSGGRAFWRLRAQGFETEADARRFCAALLAEQTSCIPVTLR